MAAACLGRTGAFVAFAVPIKNVLGLTAKDVFATLNYSKMHITVNANKNTKLTPIALNIVYSPPRVT